MSRVFRCLGASKYQANLPHLMLSGIYGRRGGTDYFKVCARRGVSLFLLYLLTTYIISRSCRGSALSLLIVLKELDVYKPWFFNTKTRKIAGLSLLDLQSSSPCAGYKYCGSCYNTSHGFLTIVPGSEIPLHRWWPWRWRRGYLLFILSYFSI